ncbi:response regulator transcription factor [Sporosarcina sp. YIM B06819]|uniref:response regulator transcription factor n=1 Tax=Sporosarcina sp. YIM B06819 TaxID=3081769 RepID=UPI00298D3A53|nr:response regulator [Sporosarcina sp. YIM B06819]
MYKMLIVDDDWLIAESLKAMDGWIDYNIDVVGTAGNGKEALYWLDKVNIDFILTDIRMPHMDGISLAKYLHENMPSINVIIMSGYEDFSYAKSAIKYNVKGYVLKPIDVNELFELVNNVQKKISISDETAPLKVESGLTTQQERLILSAKSYIQSNYMNPITLINVANKFHLTEHYFGQIFKSISGETFITYLTKVRLDKACNLLNNPSITIYKVSELIGYTDSKHFTKVFKKSFGITPSEYRRKVSVK